MRSIVLILALTALVESSSYVTFARAVTQARGSGIQDLSSMIENLYSRNQQDRFRTKLQIWTLAEKSQENRARIIRELIPLLSKNQTPSRTWYDLADLLGELKATEAIGELVRQLDYNDGSLGLSNAHWPAVKALVRIGDPAVPELARALTEGKDSIKWHAATALGEIRGSEAKRALQRALETERDRSLRELIRRSLEVAR